MKHILGMPLAKFLGIRESSKEDALLELDYSPNVNNHLNLFHASAIFSLAEFSSGAFLVKNFPIHRKLTIPLLRSSTLKYSTIPVNDSLHSKGVLIKQDVDSIHKKLDQFGKVTINIQIDIFDVTDKLVFRGKFEWFVRMNPETLKVSKTSTSLDK